MKSFGLWYERSATDKTKDVQFELHVNFWSESIGIDKKKKVPYLDIGIKIINYPCVDKLTFQCPFRVLQNEFKDLSEIISKDKTADMIFNDNCNVSSTMGVTRITVKDQELMIVSENSVRELYELKEEDGRTNIVINLNKFIDMLNNKRITGSNVAYIRFRIKTAAMKDSIYFDSEPINKSFDSAFSGTRIIDFKINNKRNLDEKIFAEVKPEEFPVVNTIHLLIMEPASYDIESFSKESMTCRELENDLWGDYLEEGLDSGHGHILAYHWKKEEPFQEYLCLVKVRYSRAKKSTIAAYVSIAISIGMMASILVTLIQMNTDNKSMCFGILGITMSVILFLVGLAMGKYIK